MTLTTERQQFAEQNEMSMDFVNWFFDEKKESFGNMWFLMAAAMWEAWKGRDNREAQPVLYASEETLAYAKEGEKSLVTWSEPMGDAVIPLFTAPPAPAVNAAPDFEAWFNSPEAGIRVVNFHIQHELQKKAWEACRAAMLAAAPDGWIACSERMPEFEDDYYLTYAGGVISVDCLIGKSFSDRYATHWMPLPAAPGSGN